MANEAEYPKTPREALMMIRHAVADPTSPVSLLAEEGLKGNVDFNDIDRIGDALAQAHKVLRAVKKGRAHLMDVNAALSLPPDLEMMVERRIGHED